MSRTHRRWALSGGSTEPPGGVPQGPPGSGARRCQLPATRSTPHKSCVHGDYCPLPRPRAWGTHYGAVNGVQVVGDRLPRPGHGAFQGRELYDAHDGADVCAERLRSGREWRGPLRPALWGLPPSSQETGGRPG